MPFMKEIEFMVVNCAMEYIKKEFFHIEEEEKLPYNSEGVRTGFETH